MKQSETRRTSVEAWPPPSSAQRRTKCTGSTAVSEDSKGIGLGGVKIEEKAGSVSKQVGPSLPLYMYAYVPDLIM